MAKKTKIQATHRGFTIIELMIVILITGILFTLVVNNVHSTRVIARDTERKADIATLARQLEDYHSGAGQGQYPSTAEVSSSDTWLRANLKGLDAEALRAPGSSTYSIKPASNAARSIHDIVPKPALNEYVYQPIDRNPGSDLCTAMSQNCRSFTLYYKSEIDGLIYMHTSLHQ